MECDVELVKKLAEIAMLEIPDEEVGQVCRDIERIASLLKTVGEVARDAGVEPLYHVWEEIGHTREPQGGEDRSIDIEKLPVALDERGYVKIPWRGGRIAGFN